MLSLLLVTILLLVTTNRKKPSQLQQSTVKARNLSSARRWCNLVGEKGPNPLDFNKTVWVRDYNLCNIVTEINSHENDTDHYSNEAKNLKIESFNFLTGGQEWGQYPSVSWRRSSRAGFLQAKSTITSILDEGQTNPAAFVLREPNYFRHSMAINFDLYLFLLCYFTFYSHNHYLFWLMRLDHGQGHGNLKMCCQGRPGCQGVGSRGLASVYTDSKVESGQLSMLLTLLSVMIWETGVISILLIPLDILEGTEIALWMRCSMEASVPLDWDRWCVLYALIHIVPYLSGYNRYIFF